MTSSVTQMLHDLGWRDLSDRRQNLRLALLYKVVTGRVAVGPDQIGLVAADNKTRANHRFTFKAIGASSSGLTRLNWEPLASRRHAARLLMFYKIHNGLVATPMPLDIKLHPVPTRVENSGIPHPTVVM